LLLWSSHFSDNAFYVQVKSGLLRIGKHLSTFRYRSVQQNTTSKHPSGLPSECDDLRRNSSVTLNTPSGSTLGIRNIGLISSSAELFEQYSANNLPSTDVPLLLMGVCIQLERSYRGEGRH